MNWIRIASTDQLTDDDEVIPVAAGDKQLALYRSEGEFYASDNVCTHAYALLSDGYLEDGCIECPLHQARFDIRTGKAVCARPPPPASASTRQGRRPGHLRRSAGLTMADADTILIIGAGQAGAVAAASAARAGPRRRHHAGRPGSARAL